MTAVVVTDRIEQPYIGENNVTLSLVESSGNLRWRVDMVTVATVVTMPSC